MKITMVKKIMPDGSDCPKCLDVLGLLENRGHMDKISAVLEASPKDPAGEGMQLVKRLKMKRAPFFLVEKDDGSEIVFDSVLRMLKEVFPDN
ncbi:MAG: hypothetical protein QGI24_08510 [Kiritimatiellia bacterium]|jgi:hypothetical protein|nr:hypothetical protein [Kiritimatiellia bacterium]